MVRVALVKAQSRYEGVMQALRMIEKEIGRELSGRKILIKPNMVNTDNQNSATNVEALRAVIEFICRYDPEEILVGEGSGGGKNSFPGFRNYGYLDLKEEFPELKFYDFNQEDDYEIISIINTNREEVDVRISKKALEDWYRISLTKPKTHETAILTLSMKNMMGCIVGRDKSKMHGHMPRVFGPPPMNNQSFKPPMPGPRRGGFIEGFKVFHRNVIRLLRAIPPSLSVIDGFEAMGGNGPCFGEMIDLGVTVASSNYVAADAVMSKVLGFDPSNIGYIYYADKEGLGCGNLSKIEIIGERIEDVKIKLEPHPNYEDELKWKLSEWYP